MKGNHMRWKAKQKPQVFDERVCHGFLWFPRKIMGEWRWWEKTAWVQTLYMGWVDTRWLCELDYRYPRP